jgi:RND family efflux transporter MFP subunit
MQSKFSERVGQKMRLVIVAAGILIAAVGAAFVAFSFPAQKAAVDTDPRQQPPIVRVATAVPVAGFERVFTGVIAARVQSNLGFRVPGKILDRLVNSGQEVKAGQALMRIDDTDLKLALTAKRNAVAAARAVLIQVTADEKRYAALVDSMAASRQRYEQAKSALDTATAQLAAVEAEARVAENEVNYALLVADADGTVMETLGEPGQVVLAGQAVVQIAQAGPREAVVALPETVRPAIGSDAEARLFGNDQHRYSGRLRQLSNAADPRTRTYEARYVLEGDAASAPLGSTVTVRITNDDKRSEVSIPIAAILNDGNRTGVWLLDRSASTVRFAPVQVKQLGGETAIVTGIELGQEVVALGAHLLSDGAFVRTSIQAQAGK